MTWDASAIAFSFQAFAYDNTMAVKDITGGAVQEAKTPHWMGPVYEWYCGWKKPSWMVDTLQMMRYSTYQLLQDFFHSV